MKKNVGMTIAEKSKETRVGMKDGNGINLCYVYHIHICRVACSNGHISWLDIHNKDNLISILHPYPCFLTFLSNGHPYILTEMFFFSL